MDQELLHQIYQKYQRELYLYIYSLCHSRELSEDLLQETFLKAILSLSDNHTNMRAWLYMVARNLFFNYVKKEKQKVPLEELGQMAEASNPEPEEQLIRDEHRRLLYQALQHLSVEKREVLILQYFGGLSQKEIAAVLHKTPENVRVLAFRGKRELKHLVSMLRYMDAQTEFKKMLMVDNIDFDQIADDIEEQGIRIYGIAGVTDKETLLDLSEQDGVYYIHTELLR